MTARGGLALRRQLVDDQPPAEPVMRDVIDFTAPLGPVGGLVASLILRPYLQRLIARRNAYLAATLARLPHDESRRKSIDEGEAQMGRETS